MINPSTFDQRFPDVDTVGLATCGDWHIGSQNCDELAVEAWVDQIREEKYYVLLMGDLTENALPSSVGAVMEQAYPPKVQVQRICELLEPVKDYIIGAVGGNHGARSDRVAGINPDEVICFNLGVPYFGHTAFGRIQVGDAHYKIVAHHGAGGGALLGSKLNVVAEKLSKIAPMADLYLAGHTHADVCGSDTRAEMVLGHSGLSVRPHRRHFSGTGSLLDYWGSYAEAKLLPPASKAQVVHYLHTRQHRSFGGDKIHVTKVDRRPVYF